MSLGTLGRLELALGNVEQAGDYLRELPAQLMVGRLADPTQPVWPDAIEKMITLGELDRAGAYLEQFEESARRLSSPPAVEGAQRCRGLFGAARGDPDAALPGLERIITENPEPGWPFERARTLMCLGLVRRQAQHRGPLGTRWSRRWPSAKRSARSCGPTGREPSCGGSAAGEPRPMG